LEVPNVHKLYQNFPFQGLPKCTKIGIFGLKIFYLATLAISRFNFYLRVSLEAKRKTRAGQTPRWRQMVNHGQASGLPDGLFSNQKF
jgi:hypothetical protein